MQGKHRGGQIFGAELVGAGEGGLELGAQCARDSGGVGIGGG